MKHRSTTPVSPGLATKSILVAAAVLMVIAAPMTAMPRVRADRFDDQINALQQQANEYQQQADELQRQANTLQNKLDQLQKQQAAIQTQIDVSTAQYNQLQKKIEETKQKIKDNKDALGTTLADLYVDDSISPLEMLASSKNIGDYVDKQTYRTSVSQTLTDTISTIKDLQAKLEKDKTAVKNVLDKQNAQKSSLVALRAQQQSILNETKGKEAAYQQQVAASQAQLQSVAAQQRAYYQSLIKSGGGNAGTVGSFQYANWSGNMGCSGGYAYCGAQDSYADPWGLYNRECVSYVAWALSARFGKYVNNFGGAGNAYQWPSSAAATRVYNPQPGDAVILPQDGAFAPLGHAMIVESVSGGWIHVSQYNFYGTGEYSTMDIRNSGVIFLRFPSR